MNTIMKGLLLMGTLCKCRLLHLILCAKCVEITAAQCAQEVKNAFCLVNAGDKGEEKELLLRIIDIKRDTKLIRKKEKKTIMIYSLKEANKRSKNVYMTTI